MTTTSIDSSMHVAGAVLTAANSRMLPDGTGVKSASIEDSSMSVTQGFRKTAQAALLLAPLLAVVPARARNRDDRCAQRIRKAEAQFETAVRKHGRHSRQAETRRRELDRVRAQCNHGGKL
jgi:hypothetical protein